jgi:hypothetical protein
MPVITVGFHPKPFGFFDGNPMLDLRPRAALRAHRPAPFSVDHRHVARGDGVSSRVCGNDTMINGEGFSFRGFLRHVPRAGPRPGV